MAHHEVETAFEVPPDAPLPDLAGVPGVARVEHRDPDRLVAVYWDSPRLDLARAGVSMRRRTGGHDAGWHLKVPLGGGDEGRRRAEHGADLTSATPPDELVALVRSRLRDAAPEPVVELVTTRTVTLLLDEDGAVLAEVADDVVEARTPRHAGPDGEGGPGGGDGPGGDGPGDEGPGDGGPRGGDDPGRGDGPGGGDAPAGDGTRASAHAGALARWREWEVELVAGDDALLAAAGAALAAAGGVPRATSKLRRALGAAVPAPPSPEPADGTAAEAVRARVARDVERLLAAETGVRLGDDEAVHDARVAVRRLRTTLGVFRPVVDRGVTEPVRDDLREVGRTLGAARDPFVEQAALLERLAAEPVELVLGPVERRVSDDRSAARDEALVRAVALLDAPEHLRLLTTLDAWSTALPRGPRADDDAADVLPRRVARAWRRLERRAREADDATGEARDVARHALRKAARRARYAATTAAPVVGRPARRSASRAHAVQDVLGRQQDTVVRRATLRRLGVQAHLDGENAFTFGRLHALEQAAAESTEREAARAVRRALAPKHRAWTA